MKSIKQYLIEGGELFKKSKYQEALDLVNEAIQFYPDDYDTWMNKNLLLAKLGRHQESFEALKMANSILLQTYNLKSKDGNGNA